MESKINTIEAMFTKTEADLNYAIRRLDDENAKADEDSQGGSSNPVRLAQSLDAIKTEFTSLREEALELEKAQREAAGVLQREMANLTAVLVQMQRQGVGVDVEGGSVADDPIAGVQTLEAELTRLTNSLPTDSSQQSKR